jgi:hypothetical protein
MAKYAIEYKKVHADDVTKETRHVKTTVDSASALQGVDGILGQIAAAPEGLEFLTVRLVRESKPFFAAKKAPLKETK